MTSSMRWRSSEVEQSATVITIVRPESERRKTGQEEQRVRNSGTFSFSSSFSLSLSSSSPTLSKFPSHKPHLEVAVTVVLGVSPVV